jgi:threonine/homoserine/homoserine lactone efflux protein
MVELLGEFVIFKIAGLAGVAYLIYFFVKDRRGKK